MVNDSMMFLGWMKLMLNDFFNYIYIYIFFFLRDTSLDLLFETTPKK